MAEQFHTKSIATSSGIQKLYMGRTTIHCITAVNVSIPISQDSYSGECKRGTKVGKNVFVSNNQKQNI